MSDPRLINPELIKWARERSPFTLKRCKKKISTSYQDWKEGRGHPTLKQIEEISKKLYVPFGYLFLSNPPEEKLPIPDFRTTENKRLNKPSINLLETIYDAQRKQNWLREEKIKDKEGKLIVQKEYTEIEIIDKIKNILDIVKLREKANTYEKFLSDLMKKLDEKGFLVIRNGVVGNNNKRSLDHKEFKGFALFDEYAPAIFINNKDYKAKPNFYSHS